VQVDRRTFVAGSAAFSVFAGMETIAETQPMGGHGLSSAG
jgi:hypothetical protein